MSLTTAFGMASVQAEDDGPYPLTADSKPQPGVPQGQVFEFTFEHSKIFPGTARKIKVYVPAQYDGRTPACVYVGLDDLRFEVPVVFDNLIHRREMPVTVAIAIAHGSVESARPPENPRFNRSFEFDALNGDLARFLLEEIFPEVERRQTSDGRKILLSQDPNDRAAGGASTGGIGSFTLAWERPDAFRRVFTSIGTFVGMRGGDRYPVLVRKTEPKPIRVFMQDGSNDGLPGRLDEVGDWWMSNQTMERALTFAGYRVEHVWGEGKHDTQQAAAVFPDAMRWLWKDWPQPVTAGESKNQMLGEILVAGQTWQPVAAVEQTVQYRLTDALRYRVKDAQGREYATDRHSGEVWLTVPGGKKTRLDSGLKAPTGIVLSPDGLWLAVAESATHWGYSYRVQPDGTVQNKQRYYWFHVPDTADDSGAGAWVADRDGRFYAATRMGVQVFDRNGRSRGILPVPGGEATTLLFAGANLDILYVRCADGRVYRRILKVSGFAAGGPPIPLPELKPS